MKFFLYLYCALAFVSTAQAKARSVEEIFQKNKVKLKKTEVFEGRKIYYVELPFDPNVGRNSNHLEGEISTANGCRPFTLVSDLDKVRVNVDTKKTKGGCSLTEDIQPAQ